MTKRSSWTELKAKTPLTSQAQAAYDDEARDTPCVPSSNASASTPA